MKRLLAALACTLALGGTAQAAIDTYEFAIDYIDQINAVTVDDIQRVAARIFDTDGYAMVIRRRDKDVPPGQEVRLHCPNAS